MSARRSISQEYVEYKKKHRPLKVYLSYDRSLFRTILADDTKKVGELIPDVGALVGFQNATDVRVLYECYEEDSST